MEFNTFYDNRENREYLINICYKFYNTSVIKQFTEFDDFHQLAMIKLSKYLPTYDNTKCKLSTFIYRIVNSVHNTILQTESYKKRDINIRLQTLSLDYINSEMNDSLESALESNFNLENELNDIEWYIEKYLGALKNELEKKILILKYQGYTNKEICAMLDITKHTIDSTIKSIKIKLERTIKKV